MSIGLNIGNSFAVESRHRIWNREVENIDEIWLLGLSTFLRWCLAAFSTCFAFWLDYLILVNLKKLHVFIEASDNV